MKGRRTRDPSNNDNLIPLGACSYLDDDSNAKYNTPARDEWSSPEFINNWRCDQSSDQGANRELVNVTECSVRRLGFVAIQDPL